MTELEQIAEFLDEAEKVRGTPDWTEEDEALYQRLVARFEELGRPSIKTAKAGGLSNVYDRLKFSDKVIELAEEGADDKTIGEALADKDLETVADIGEEKVTEFVEETKKVVSDISQWINDNAEELGDIAGIAPSDKLRLSLWVFFILIREGAEYFKELGLDFPEFPVIFGYIPPEQFGEFILFALMYAPWLGRLVPPKMKFILTIWSLASWFGRPALYAAFEEKGTVERRIIDGVMTLVEYTNPQRVIVTLLQNTVRLDAKHIPSYGVGTTFIDTLGNYYKLLGNGDVELVDDAVFDKAGTKYKLYFHTKQRKPIIVGKSRQVFYELSVQHKGSGKQITPKEWKLGGFFGAEGGLVYQNTGGYNYSGGVLGRARNKAGVMNKMGIKPHSKGSPMNPLINSPTPHQAVDLVARIK